MRPWVIFLLFLCAPSRLFSQNQGPSVASAEPKAAASLTALVQEAMDRNPEIQATKRAWVPRAALRNNSASISRPPESATSLRWGSSAKLHRGLAKVSGTLIIDGAGVEFRPDKGSTIRWPFVEIQTLDLWPRRIVLIGYEKRGRFRPGVRRYRFDPGSENAAFGGCRTLAEGGQAGAQRKSPAGGLQHSHPLCSPPHGLGRNQEQRDFTVRRVGDRLRYLSWQRQPQLALGRYSDAFEY